MDTSDFAKRMKEYEDARKDYLTKRVPVMIRIDGKAFHTFTRGLARPFDDILIEAMQRTMKYLCENISGCVLGYTQSDEITLLLIDYKSMAQGAWFGYVKRKVETISASMATMAFNNFYTDILKERVRKELEECQTEADKKKVTDYYAKYARKCGKAMFDSRAFKKKYSLNFGVYYTPAENLCFTAMTKFKEKYGEIPNVSDKKFFTNSMHVPVWEEMSPFEKIDIESQLTGYSSAGCITYVELESSIKNNLDALEEIVNYAMDHDIPYFAVNVPNDMCTNCGYTDEIGEKCPICGCTKIRRLRRVTGYLTGDYIEAFNEGKQQEVDFRVKHFNRRLKRITKRYASH